jgi:hypothetical protein
MSISMERLPKKNFHLAWDIQLPHNFPDRINLCRPLTISSSGSIYAQTDHPTLYDTPTEQKKHNSCFVPRNKITW